MYNVTPSYKDEETVADFSGSQYQLVAEPEKRAQGFSHFYHCNINTTNFNLHSLCTDHARCHANQVCLFYISLPCVRVCVCAHALCIVLPVLSWEKLKLRGPWSYAAIFGTGRGGTSFRLQNLNTLLTKSGTPMLISRI